MQEPTPLQDLKFPGRIGINCQQEEHDRYYLSVAYNLAIRNSIDPSTQNGAVLVSYDMDMAGWIIGSGVNEFPRGVKNTPERWERPLKYSVIEHAERNAIYNAAQHGHHIKGSTLFCPWIACSDCSRAIIQCGIKEVVGHKTAADQDSPQWKQSIAIAMTMLEEAGVNVRYFDGVIGVKMRFNGNVVDR